LSFVLERDMALALDTKVCLRISIIMHSRYTDSNDPGPRTRCTSMNADDPLSELLDLCRNDRHVRCSEHEARRRALRAFSRVTASRWHYLHRCRVPDNRKRLGLRRGQGSPKHRTTSALLVSCDVAVC